MTYYGIVDKIREEHKGGIYGRRKLTEEEKKKFDILEYLGFTSDFGTDIVTKTSIKLASTIKTYTVIGIAETGITYFKKKLKKNSISLQVPSEELVPMLIIKNDYLENDYSLENDNIFYGLFDAFISKSRAFEKIMKSNGGSTLLIMERDSVPKQMHFGGLDGRFNFGLYCLHPKDSSILLPLEDSPGLIQKLILEETIRAYEALGAKRIMISDKTERKLETKKKLKISKISSSSDYQSQVLREIHFGKGTFDPDRALKNSLFIHDIPAIVSTLQGRIKGNQIIEKFSETINLSLGIDVDVIKLFKLNANFEQMRTWSFEVEFYDKNEL